MKAFAATRVPIGGVVFAAIASVLTVLSTLIFAPAAAAAEPTWVPFADATIHPGVQTITGDRSQCTSNFVFHDNREAYIGQAAHCAIDGAAAPAAEPALSAPSGCNTPSLPLGTEVLVGGASRPGTLVYSSWITMQELGETDFNTCAANDFALIKLDRADHGLINPTMPVWGGPTGLATSTSPGDKVLTYGNSSLRLGIQELRPLVGVSRGQSAGGWTHTVLTVTPGIPGDSGSGFIDAEGRAFGVLSTLIFLPQPAQNGVGDLSRQLDYMRTHSDLDQVELALGTEPFKGESALDTPLSLLEPVLSLLELPLLLLRDLGA